MIPVKRYQNASVIAVLLCLLANFYGFAQTPLGAEVELGGWAATSQAQPFWLRTNQYGIVPLTAPAATVRAAIWKGYRHLDSTNRRTRKFDWRFGINAVANASSRNQVLLPEAYIKVRFKSIELSTGRWRQLTGLGDSTLSSGFINGSGNALPIPKVQLATQGYVPLKFTRNWVALNAGFGHGWFNVPYVRGSYLHQKYVYVRVGKPTKKLKAYLGINHEVQWAGQADYLIGTPLAVNGKIPSKFKYYPDVVLGLRPADLANNDYTNFDGTYWIGNSLGSTDLGLELTTQRGTWLFYHQHIYEDFSGLLWINFPDGLTGISWQRKPGSKATSSGWIQRFVIEFLSTMDQSGSTFIRANSIFQGADNYFNHSQYREGWSYLGRTIGTPFIMPQSDVQAGAKGANFFPNNLVKMGYIGVQGVLLKSLAWTFRTSYSLNYGMFNSPYPTPCGQLSSLLSTQIPLTRWPKIIITTSLALDQGQLLPNTVGGYVSVKKNW